MPATTPLLVEQTDGLRWLALNRPAAANSLDPALSDAFVAALAAAAGDDAAAAVILTGAGERVFSAGVDLKNPDGLAPAALAERRAGVLVAMVEAVLDFPKPLVVAVNGKAVGGGCLIALLGDRIVAAGPAVFSLPEMRLGMPSFLGAAIVGEFGGSALSFEMVLGGREMSAGEAARRGLVAMAGPNGLQAAAESAARSLADMPRQAYADLKSWLQNRRRRVIAEAVAMAAYSRASAAPDGAAAVTHGDPPRLTPGPDRNMKT